MCSITTYLIPLQYNHVLQHHLQQQAHGRRIMGNPSGPTIITVNGIYDSIMFNSMDEPNATSVGHGGGQQVRYMKHSMSSNTFLPWADYKVVAEGLGITFIPTPLRLY
jgi:hypothetical protein